MKLEWNRGYWQANADIETEGNVLHWYTQASADFKAGYRTRIATYILRCSALGLVPRGLR